jgi:hypothetical protein
MGRPRTLEERILRFLMREDVELRGEDLWRAIGGGRLFGPDRRAFHASLRRLESFGILDCRDEHGGPWRGSRSDLIYRLSDGARATAAELAGDIGLAIGSSLRGGMMSGDVKVF